jgi:hypothetical protein
MHEDSWRSCNAQEQEWKPGHEFTITCHVGTMVEILIRVLLLMLMFTLDVVVGWVRVWRQVVLQAVFQAIALPADSRICYKGARFPLAWQRQVNFIFPQLQITPGGSGELDIMTLQVGALNTAQFTQVLPQQACERLPCPYEISSNASYVLKYRVRQLPLCTVLCFHNLATCSTTSTPNYQRQAHPRP